MLLHVVITPKLIGRIWTGMICYPKELRTQYTSVSMLSDNHTVMTQLSRNAQFDTNLPIKLILNQNKCQMYSFFLNLCCKHLLYVETYFRSLLPA